MENNNGRGIFYGVIGVATLVVAIIGATFAYFSASAANNNAIHVGATRLELKFLEEDSNFYDDLIPVKTVGQEALFKTFPGMTVKDTDAGTVGANTCSDLRGNSICGVYTFTINNPSDTVSQKVYGSIQVVKSGFTNLSYAVFKGEPDDNLGNYDLSLTPASVDLETTKMVVGRTKFGAEGSQPVNWPNVTQVLEPGQSQAYTVVVWLEDEGPANNEEQGATFSAAIKFDTGSDSGVTGFLTAEAQG